MKNIYEPFTITIGIPALNEEKNIGALLESLLAQSERVGTIEKIIVASDGSSDNTAHVVRSFSDPRIFLIDGKERKGKALRQNEMILHCASDVLVFLDSDIKIESDDFIGHLVLPIVEKRADFSSGEIMPLAPRGIIDGALAHAMRVKSFVYRQMNDGDNVYCCFGPARAFARRAYEKLSFRPLVAEDAYSYFQMKQSGMRFCSEPLATFFVRVPSSISDHQKQSVRFLNSHKELSAVFGEKFVMKEYSIPLQVQFNGVVYSFIISPFYSVMYVMLFGYMKCLSYFSRKPQAAWERAVTSQEI